jgi:hypothetical protein
LPGRRNLFPNSPKQSPSLRELFGGTGTEFRRAVQEFGGAAQLFRNPAGDFRTRAKAPANLTNLFHKERSKFMPSRYKADKVIEGSERISRVWTDNPTFTLGEVTLPSLNAKIASLRQKRDQLETLRMQVTALSNEIDGATDDLSTIRTRALSGLRATYGPNSTQYEQGGGTRQSEVKRPSRKGGGGSGTSD